jgi:hypothetical protein
MTIAERLHALGITPVMRELDQNLLSACVQNGLGSTRATLSRASALPRWRVALRPILSVTLHPRQNPRDFRRSLLDNRRQHITALEGMGSK